MLKNRKFNGGRDKQIFSIRKFKAYGTCSALLGLLSLALTFNSSIALAEINDVAGAVAVSPEISAVPTVLTADSSVAATSTTES